MVGYFFECLSYVIGGNFFGFKIFFGLFFDIVFFILEVESIGEFIIMK